MSRPRPPVDERAFWTRAEQEESALAKSAPMLRDARLEDYLSGVAARLLPAAAREGRGLGPRVLVLRDATVNAFAMPDATVYVHTGLLARLQNEAQLAVILGHELAHATNRDAQRVEGRRNGGGHSRLDASADVATGSPVWRLLASAGLDLARQAAVDGYGRDLEREADRETLTRMVAAHYDPREARRALARLRADASGAPAFLLGNRVALTERLDVTEALLATRDVGIDERGPVTGAEAYSRQTRIAVRENAALQIRAGRFEEGQSELDRALALEPRDPTALVYYGDLYRLKAQRAPEPNGANSLLARAREKYEEAAILDPAYPAAFRQMGLLYYQEGHASEAALAFKKYLTLEPDAPDARRIEEYVIELDR